MPKRKVINTKESKLTYPIVEVIWTDAAEYGEIGWNTLKDMLRESKKPCPTMNTVGYCVYYGDEHIALLSTIGGDECSRLDKIPLAFVKDIIFLSGGTADLSE